MKFLRFSYQGTESYGVLQEETVTALRGDPFNDLDFAKEYHLSEVTLLAPVIPSKIVAVGLNYVDHARELQMEIPEEPILFMKPPTSLSGPGGNVVYPAMTHQLDYEAELAVVLKKKARFVMEEEVDDVVLGYTCSNDITARDLQRKDGQWTRAKCFDTFAPLGPYVETDLDPGNLSIELFLNGERKQSSSTSNMIFDCARLVSFVSQIMTLLPGDVIMTGTPPGVGPMNAGDVVEVVIEGIGSLRNMVVKE
jgi:2-keto-4-pentenoate hydratase/2-oxohepta-3-ene-1,7-dioic acid hydratase in catechol pathway